MKLAFIDQQCTNPIRTSDWLKLQKLNIFLGECTACYTGPPTLWPSTVVYGNGLRRNQSDCSISNLDQSEGRIWPTWRGRVERVFWGLGPSLIWVLVPLGQHGNEANRKWRHGNRKWRHGTGSDVITNRKWAEINDRPRGLTKNIFIQRSGLLCGLVCGLSGGVGGFGGKSMV